MHGLKGNAPGIVGLFLLAVPVAAWILIVLKQYGFSRPKTYRVNVLIARTSFFLPSYAFFVWISLVEPQVFEGMQIAFTIIEAMSFYCFFAMIVANLGGASNAIKTMRAANKTPFCSCCCPGEPGAFYMRVYNSLWYMLWIRVPVITIATIGYYNELNSIYLLGTLVGLLILGNAFLKMSIGIIVIEGKIVYIYIFIYMFICNIIQPDNHIYVTNTLTIQLTNTDTIYIHVGLLETIMWQAGAFDNTDVSSGYSQEGTVIRYCKCVWVYTCIYIYTN